MRLLFLPPSRSLPPLDSLILYTTSLLYTVPNNRSNTVKRARENGTNSVYWIRRLVPKKASVKRLWIGLFHLKVCTIQNVKLTVNHFHYFSFSLFPHFTLSFISKATKEESSFLACKWIKKKAEQKKQHQSGRVRESAELNSQATNIVRTCEEGRQIETGSMLANVLHSPNNKKNDKSSVKNYKNIEKESKKVNHRKSFVLK